MIAKFLYCFNVEKPYFPILGDVTLPVYIKYLFDWYCRLV
jgi:hypothetical protein